ncbi:hypothetical protein BGZ99_008370 [Dissophora globulifera]|uniref:Uncharacterized protein n=1 Tax=Dissophora globulifera TaxID=979702 RepID=A0A9P6UPW4_9FUNG|nr:hypothetical protein BGZ99_008370 [Dissophora globulifera]
MDCQAAFNLNMSEYVQINQKVFFAAAERNKDVIAEQLRPILNNAQLVLEVGSGSGQHVYHLSKDLPDVIFQPTEYSVSLLPSIDAYAEDLIKEGHYILPALELDATNPEHWQRVLTAAATATSTESSEVGKEPQQALYDLVMTTNVFHISPWIVSESIIRGAGQVLKSGGYLVIYGPFRRNGSFNTESNREFDATLRGRDSSWGVRDLEEVEKVAKEEAGLTLERVVDVPSNNYMVFFRKL